MDTIILKFGGSSVADNIKLNIVAEKIINLKKEAKNIVAVVSAQGKTTDKLIKEAKELSAIPEKREMDILLSIGEQETASKLSILLNRMGHKTVSLLGWQAGIFTNNIYGSAKIEKIYTKRIKEELAKKNIVIVAGFQGINKNGDITTLGRSGSDTTAVALQAALGAEKSYIFSDVDGIYSTDPNMTTLAKKLDEISFSEMQEIADAGAKVLHNRCIQIGEKFDCNIELASTFKNIKGTDVCKCIETAEVKSIVLNDNLIQIEAINNKEIKKEGSYKIYKELLKNNIIVESYQNFKGCISFRTKKEDIDIVQNIFENKFIDYKLIQKEIYKLTIVGYGIIQDNTILNKVIKILDKKKIEIFNINLKQNKIEIILNNLEKEIIDELHKNLIIGGI